MDLYFLQSARLGFRQWAPEDLPFAQALWGDPETTRFIGGPFSPEEIRQRLTTEITLHSRHNVQYWPFFLLDTREHAGCAGLRPYRPEDRVFELGVHLRPTFWGRGLAEEAARSVIKFAFESAGAKALFAGHQSARPAGPGLRPAPGRESPPFRKDQESTRMARKLRR